MQLYQAQPLLGRLGCRFAKQQMQCRRQVRLQATKQKPPFGPDQLPNPYTHERCAERAVRQQPCTYPWSALRLSHTCSGLQGSLQQRRDHAARQLVRYLEAQEGRPVPGRLVQLAGRGQVQGVMWYHHEWCRHGVSFARRLRPCMPPVTAEAVQYRELLCSPPALPDPPAVQPG